MKYRFKDWFVFRLERILIYVFDCLECISLVRESLFFGVWFFLEKLMRWIRFWRKRFLVFIKVLFDFEFLWDVGGSLVYFFYFWWLFFFIIDNVELRYVDVFRRDSFFFNKWRMLEIIIFG